VLKIASTGDRWRARGKFSDDFLTEIDRRSGVGYAG
jgi:hypothetical protein